MSIDETMDAHFGMISREQAASISGAEDDTAGGKLGTNDIATSRALLEFIAANRDSTQQAYAVNVKDRVYRIFNPLRRGDRPESYRTVVLGSEGSTIQMRASGGISDYIDSAAVCRGDLVFVKGAVLDMKSESLAVSRRTLLTKLASSAVPAVSDFSALREGQRNIDVVGRVTEIGQIRNVAKLGGDGNVAVSDCILSDGAGTLRVSMWESSAAATSSMRINSTVRIEFCSVRLRNGETELYASDLSRVLQFKG